MKIRNVIHKGLRRFIVDDDASGLQPAVLSKVRRIVSFLQDMEREDELRTVPSWKAHQPTGCLLYTSDVYKRQLGEVRPKAGMGAPAECL